MYYFDDNQFGSSVQGTGTDKSGQITYCSIKIDFSTGAPPANPTATYNKQKNELVVSSTDPDGDQIRYGVSWNNDQTVDEWTTYYNSGEEVTIDCEGREGPVGVVSEDSTGRHSEWVSVKPKSNIMIWSFLEKFPILNSLFRVLFF